jgi:hypothetical protein
MAQEAIGEATSPAFAGGERAPAQADVRAQRVVELARRVAGRPNDARLHADLAVAYFERGALGDAERAMNHRTRAGDLDPDVSSLITGRLETARAGFDERPPTAEMALADLQAAATLPPRGPAAGDDIIRARLAARLARARFEAPSTEFPRNVERIARMFHSPGDPTRLTAEQAGSLARAARAGSRDPLDRGLIEALRRNAERRENAARLSPASGSAPAADEPPDPMLTKARAYLKLVDGDVDAGVRELETTAAAAETLSRRDLEGDERARAPEAGPNGPLAGFGRLPATRPAQIARIANRSPADRMPEGAGPGARPIDDDDWGDDEGGDREAPVRAMRTPSRDLTDVTPSRVDTPPRTDPGARPPAAAAAAPDRVARIQTPPPADPAAGSSRRPLPSPSAAPVAPPARNRAIAERSLEVLEAVRAPEVPPSEATRRARDLAAIGEVGEPLVIDLDGDGTPSVPGGLAPDGRLDARARARFDLDADGRAELVEWISPGDALVAFDLDGDGRIASGKELPGAVSARGAPAAWLAVRDVDRDGALTGAELAGCVLWRDDGDGVCEEGEVLDARAAGVLSLTATRARVAGGERAIWEWWPDVSSEAE